MPIEGSGRSLSGAWYGTHHHYSEKYMPLYIAEACWKYNNGRTTGRLSGRRSRRLSTYSVAKKTDNRIKGGAARAYD